MLRKGLSSALSGSSFQRKEPVLRDSLPALIVILSRRRRISVQAAYETNDSKYQSAGRSRLRRLLPLWCLTAPPSPRCIGRATKGRRLYGQARRLTSPDLHILCRMCTVDNKAPRGCNIICGSILCTGCCAPACGGKVVAPATKGGGPNGPGFKGFRRFKRFRGLRYRPCGR